MASKSMKMAGQTSKGSKPRGGARMIMQMPDPYQDARDMRRRTAKTLAEMRGKK